MARRKKGKKVATGTVDATAAEVIKWQVIGSAFNNFCKYGSYAFGLFCGWQAIVALAGRETSANIWVGFWTNVFGSHLATTCVLAFMVGVGGTLYGLVERRSRQRNTARLSGRIEQLEKHIDPGRSTSKLTPSGETNPEDRI
jgi:hypothetical protein